MDGSTTAPRLAFINRKGLKARGINYSNCHLIRMENAGAFPRRLYIGQNRIGWVEAEIEAWMRERIAERDADLDLENAADEAT